MEGGWEVNINYNGDLKTKYVHKIVLLTCPFLEHLLLKASRVGDENTEATWLTSVPRPSAPSVTQPGTQIRARVARPLNLVVRPRVE